MSRAVAVLGLLFGASLVGLGGCNDDRPLVLEAMHQPAFDPVTWDPGPQPPARGSRPEGLVFGITPFYSPERQAPALERMRSYLEEELQIPVRAEVAPSYEQVVVRLNAGQIDIAQLSPFAFVQAQRSIDDLVPLACAVAQGTTTYASYLIVQAESPARTLDDLKGKRLGFTDRWSTSGFIVPAAWMRKKGFNPASDFDVVWLSTHDRALEAVKNGEVAVAAVSGDTVVTQRAVGIGGPVRILAKPGRIPYDAIAVRSTMDPALIWQVRRAFLRLSVHSERGVRVLEDYNLINGFMPIPPGHYDDVFGMATELVEESGPGRREDPGLMEPSVFVPPPGKLPADVDGGSAP